MCGWGVVGYQVQVLNASRLLENRLHWSLDVVFGEDACGVTKRHGPENLNTLRKLALSLS
jgi:predicted transposase YbfD/YdcC